MKALQQKAWSFLRRPTPVWGMAFLLVGSVAVFIFGPALRTERQRAVSVDGVVERKEISAWDSRYGSRIFYFVVVRQKSGETVRVLVDRPAYERARSGMPARKAAGEQWPHIGEAAR